MAFWKRKKRAPAVETLAENPYKLKEKINLLHYTLAENNMVSVHSGPQGIYTYVNHYCKALLGYEPEELIGKSAYSFIHPDDIESVAENHSWVLRGEDVNSSTLRLCHKNGEWIKVNCISWNSDIGVIVVTNLHTYEEAEKTIDNLNEKMTEVINVIHKLR